MKILHIITRLIVGGAQENTLLTCEGLARRGHEVMLLTGPSPGPEGTLMQRARAGGYRVIVTPHLVRSPHAWHDGAAYWAIKKLVRETSPDVVHTHSSKAGILGRAAAWNVRRSDRPLVVHTVHGLPFHPWQGRAAHRLWVGLERWAARRCDKIICVADAMTKQALAAGVGRERGAGLFTTIYSGMEVGPFISPGVTGAEVRRRLNIPPTAFVYGTIARLQPLKGHDDLVAGAQRLFAAVPDAHLLWVGDGVYRSRLEQTLQQHGWRDRVTLTGLVAPGEVPGLLPAMDALVHPSYREGLARALPQALLGGVPVISYDCDGAAEVCIQGKTGFLAATGDVTALTTAMVRIASDRHNARAMGAYGQNFCVERFSAEVMVQRIEALYSELAAT